MVILLYFFSSVFIVLGFMMLFGYHRTKRKEFILLSFVYSASGVAAGHGQQWWPLIAGFVVVWLLKFAGYDADKPPANASSASRSSDPPPGGSS